MLRSGDTRSWQSPSSLAQGGLATIQDGAG